MMTNKSRLFTRIMARVAVPPGGGLGDGLKFFTDEKRRRQVIEEAKQMLEKSIELIKSAPDNPYGEDEEIICGVILEQLEKRRTRCPVNR